MPWGYAAAAVGGMALSSMSGDGGAGELSEEQARVAMEALEWDKERYAEEKPVRDKANQLALDAAQIQNDISKQQAGISQDTYDYQKDTFRPLEQGIVADAQAYDTPERREQKAGQAVSDFQTKLDASRSAMRESLAARGIDLGSGNVLAQEAAMGVQGAAGASAAANQARNDVETQGFARKMDAASLGRNLSSNQAATANTASNASSASAGSAQSAVTNNNVAASGMQSGYRSAMSGLGSAASGAAAANNSSNNNSQLLNSAMMAYAAYASDEDVKDGTGKEMSPAKALGAILKTPVHEDWKYDPAKGGPDDGGQKHDGPMAQDVQKNMGDDVAPGGKKIDIASMNGVLIAGIQGLADEVKDLKNDVKRVAGSRMAAQGVM